MWQSSLILLLAVSASLAHTSNYCSTNNLATNTSGLQFAKEPVPFEYGFEEKFKSIHCCGRGYRSIEWFKDNVSYPWSAKVSNLILYPEAANQTLYTRRASQHDSGTYTCRMSNETHTEEHTILLEILEKAPDAPKNMFISKDQWVEEGSDMRLYCEALVGRSYLADSVSDLQWRKVWPNGSEGELSPSQNEIKTKRDDIEEIVGAYLKIGDVTAADYGSYVCVAHSNNVISKHFVTVHYKSADNDFSVTPCYEDCVPWRSLILGGATILLVIFSVYALHRRYTSRVLLAVRIVHARATGSIQSPRALEKEFDVLVCWTEVDDSLVRGALLPTLSIKYKYRVHTMMLPAHTDSWYGLLRDEASRCRSVAAVVSPAQHSTTQLHTALRNLHALNNSLVVVLLQDLPKLKAEPKDSNGDNLVGALRRTKLLAWRHMHERAFWTELRLALPLPPQRNRTLSSKEDKMNETETAKINEESAKYSRSCSLTALV